MALVMVLVDRWVPMSAEYEIFVRGDPLTDPDYRVRMESSSVGGLQVRCLAPLPAGFWLRPVRGGAMYVPTGDEYDTRQFRLDTYQERL